MKKYLIRLDDACPTMDLEKWEKVEIILDKYNIKPMVGIIPNNENPHEVLRSPDPEFWSRVKNWEKKGWAIAMHGYNHCYSSNGGLNGLNPMWERSEFAGLPLLEQKKKVRDGLAIMRSRGIDPNYFFAPSHTFDGNTLVALKEESNIRIISDTIALWPYKADGFIFIPQVGGRCVKRIFPGLWTFCLHPNTMNEKSIAEVELFLKQYNKSFISFYDIDYHSVGKIDVLSRVLSWAYFAYRKIRH